jgi:DNA (cytosine-5)-methyltransferase 3A
MDARGRLFFCFSDIVKHLRKETKGKVLFLGENVRMRDEHRWVITEELGVEPVEIDSALVSAQTRHRLYWCNWPVDMPKDRHISLDDILEHDKDWNPGAIRGRYIGSIVGRRIGEDGYRKDCDMDIKITQCLEIRKDKNTTPIKKSNCLTTVMKDNVISSLPPGRYLNAFDLKDKFRYLTPVEMCRLQTLPDDYLDGIAPNTAMSLTGNGWTVDVIAHLLRGIERR